MDVFATVIDDQSGMPDVWALDFFSGRSRKFAQYSENLQMLNTKDGHPGIALMSGNMTSTSVDIRTLWDNKSVHGISVHAPRKKIAEVITFENDYMVITTDGNIFSASGCKGYLSDLNGEDFMTSPCSHYSENAVSLKITKNISDLTLLTLWGNLSYTVTTGLDIGTYKEFTVDQSVYTEFQSPVVIKVIDLREMKTHTFKHNYNTHHTMYMKQLDDNHIAAVSIWDTMLDDGYILSVWDRRNYTNPVIFQEQTEMNIQGPISGAIM